MRVEEPVGEQAWTTQVVVVGSGAGGAMVAMTLAEAGIDVILVEEGHQHARYKPTMSGATAQLYHESAMRQFQGSSPAPVASGRALGGSTIVNSAICFRTPRAVIDEWNDSADNALGRPDDFYALQDQVETLFSVTRTPDELLSGCDLAHQTAARRLGWEEDNLRRNTLNCGGCGRCNLGCTTGGKASSDLVALPRAAAAGARILTGCQVVTVAQGRIEGVLRDRDGVSQGRFVVTADRIVLSAGTVWTPGLLLASGLTGNGTVGTGFKAHPTSGVSGMLPDPVRRRGAAQGHGVTEFLGEGFLLESNPIMISAAFAVLPLFGALTHEVMSRADHLVSTGGIVRDTGTGRVLAPKGRGAQIQWSMNDADRKTLITQMRRGCELWLEGADAEWVVPSRHSGRLMRSMDEVRRWLPYDLGPEYISTYCSHPQSSCGLGRTCAPTGEVLRHPGIYCMDASVLPTAVGLNPQITVMTVATLLARRLAEDLGAVPAPVVA
jgi:choline dehydrogenase-like flavoprotein